MIETIAFIIIILIIFLFIKFNYKKCETGGEKLLFILYTITISTPIIIYYLNLWKIPSILKFTKNIEN